jgi:hypothetical protein
MASPVPPVPGETPEQRQARLDGAYRKQAEVDAEKRAEIAARGRVVEAPKPVVTLEAPPPPRPPKMPPRPKKLSYLKEKMTAVKRAAGGAAKVRKGMSSEGIITSAMNKIRGK